MGNMRYTHRAQWWQLSACASRQQLTTYTSSAAMIDKEAHKVCLISRGPLAGLTDMAPRWVHVGGRHAAHQAIPGHQLNEAPTPVDAYEAHILLHTRQV